MTPEVIGLPSQLPLPLPLNRQWIIKSKVKMCSRSYKCQCFDNIRVVFFHGKSQSFFKIRVFFWPEISAFEAFFNFGNKRMRPPLYLSLLNIVPGYILWNHRDLVFTMPDSQV